MVRIHREPPVEGAPGGAVPYKHFGARLARLGRFDSCTLYQGIFRAGSSTDQNSWPTPNRCGFNSRTAHQLTPARQKTACRGPRAGLARRSSPGAPAERGFRAVGWESAIDNREVLVRFQHPAPSFVLSTGDWQRWLMHSPLKRAQAGSIPASPTKAFL